MTVRQSLTDVSHTTRREASSNGLDLLNTIISDLYMVKFIVEGIER